MKGHKWYQSVPIDAKALVLLVKTYNKKIHQLSTAK
jgi:hypothetical protein